MERDSAPLIEAHGLTKTYGDTIAVDGIDLTVHPGEVFGLLGPNGAGKTTTILMLLGLSEPDSGSVRVAGLDPTRHPLAVKRQVGYLPDTVGFYDNLTGRQNLRFTARLNELDSDLAEGRITELLASVGLSDDADRAVGGYSRGMRQRLGVADALIKDPRVVVLDEPTAGIDPEGVMAMQDLIIRLAREEGRAVLLTSHLLHQVQQSCDRMAIFVDGRIVAEGSSLELAEATRAEQSTFEIVTDAPQERLRAAIDDLTLVRLEAVGPNRWHVEVAADAAHRLLPTLVKEGVAIREFRDLASDLDRIYHRYFSQLEEVGA